MPPTRDEFQNQYGDTILGDYDEDEDSNHDGTRERTAAQQEKDEEAPKPTADVMMSRNLKGGAGKNFNFAFGSDGDDDDSSESPTKNDRQDDNNSDKELSQPSQKFGSKPINLLSQMGQNKTGKTGGSNTGLKKGFIKPLITTDEDQFDHHMFSKNNTYDKNKDDTDEENGDPLVDVEVDMQLTMKPADRSKKSKSFLQIEATENGDEPTSLG